VKNPRLWEKTNYILGGLCLLALFLPQFQVRIWDTGHIEHLYMWGGHDKVGATVSGLLYGIAIFWGIAAAVGLFLAGRRLRTLSRSAIAWMNWAAFFLAVELIFILSAAEEVLTDLRVAQLHADSFASFGSWISFIVFFLLLFLPSRIKNALFREPKS